MSKPRDNWRPWVLSALRDYPTYKAIVDDAQAQSVTTKYNKGRGGSGINRSTELAALRSGLTGEQLREYEAITNALEEISTLPYGKQRVRLVKLVYFSRNRKTIAGAAQMVFTSERTARRWNDDMIHAVWAWLKPGGKLDRKGRKKL